MDEAAFQRAVEFAKGWLRSPAEGFKLVNPGVQDVLLQIHVAMSVESRASWDGLAEIARDMLRDGKPLPRELAAWVADVLDDQQLRSQEDRKRPRPPEKPDPARVRNLIPGVVAELCDRTPGLKPTRYNVDNVRPESCAEGGSACDVVGVVLGMKYKAVEKVWHTRPRSSYQRFRR